MISIDNRPRSATTRTLRSACVSLIVLAAGATGLGAQTPLGRADDARTGPLGTTGVRTGPLGRPAVSGPLGSPALPTAIPLGVPSAAPAAAHAAAMPRPVSAIHSRGGPGEVAPEAAGFDPIWFGVYIVIMIELAEISPPVGFNLFVLQGMTGKEITWIARVTMPFFFLISNILGNVDATKKVGRFLPDQAGSKIMQVVTPVDDGSAIRRRRQCEDCGARFTTFERIQLRDRTIVKSGNRREPFDRAKLERSIAIACRKRPVPAERIERLASSIQRQIETSGESETPSERIGEMVMEGLKALDPVAYIRFASVYKDFREARDFEHFAGTVTE